MTDDATEILQSYDRRDGGFQAEVDKARAFRQTLEMAGVDLKREGFTVPLMQRLETPCSPALVARARAFAAG